jgi:hypothetical protein
MSDIMNDLQKFESFTYNCIERRAFFDWDDILDLYPDIQRSFEDHDIVGMIVKYIEYVNSTIHWALMKDRNKIDADKPYGDEYHYNVYRYKKVHQMTKIRYKLLLEFGLVRKIKCHCHIPNSRLMYVHESSKGHNGYMSARVREATEEEIQRWCEEQSHPSFCGKHTCIFADVEAVYLTDDVPQRYIICH